MLSSGLSGSYFGLHLGRQVSSEVVTSVNLQDFPCGHLPHNKPFCLFDPANCSWLSMSSHESSLTSYRVVTRQSRVVTGVIKVSSPVVIRVIKVSSPFAFRFRVIKRHHHGSSGLYKGRERQSHESKNYLICHLSSVWLAKNFDVAKLPVLQGFMWKYVIMTQESPLFNVLKLNESYKT